MTELTDLLDRATGAVDAVDASPTSVADDLARGRAALHRRRRNRGRIAAGSLAALGILVVGINGTLGGESAPGPADVRGQQPAGSIKLVSASLTAGPYTFGKLPEGWAVQGTTAYAVTIAPTDGSTNDERDSFIGKLVIMYDQNPLSGETTTVDGREFFIRSDSGHTTIAVATRAGQPAGEVLVQFPDSAGWAQGTMIEFLDAVQVNDSAQAGKG